MPPKPFLVCLFVLGLLTGCTSNLECFEIGVDRCQRIIHAANDSVPPGYTRLYIEAGPGVRRPYHVFACYPGGGQVVVKVTLRGGGANVEPLEGVELASCR